MEKLTLKHTAIRQRLADVTWLQVDVTANTLADKALLKHFNLFGPPAILFFNAQGQEIKTVRVIGYQNVEQFQRSIANALAN
jgi:thiol:disulfide interchange protein DsbD